MYNKNNLAIGAVASKSCVRPELSCVAFYGNRTIATDAFRLIEMSANGEEKKTPVLYWAKELKKIKISKKETFGEDTLAPAIATHGDQYPKIDALFERAKDKKYVEVKVNAEYLSEICNVLKNLDPFQAITLKVPVDNTIANAVVITAEGPKEDGKERQRARALLMPMNK